MSVQYTVYRRFNGRRNAYDVLGGRRARDNNRVYVYTWIIF